MVEMPKIPPEVARERAERAARFLAADPRVKLIFLFGSAADPDRKIPVRDVDLAILTEPALELWDFLRLRADAVLAAGVAVIFDIGNHILSAEYGVSVDDYEDIVVQLARYRVISEGLETRP